MNIKQKTVYVILGMARSGTSVIARGFKALGIDLGTKLKPAKEDWNPKGFWEDMDIVYKINRGILKSAHDTSHEFKNAAIDILKERLSSTDHWGFKDPRTAMLLPFWQSVFNALNVNDYYVITLRNPLSSAKSYQKVSGCDLEECLLLWLAHMVPAIDNTFGKKRIVVSYELMTQNPHDQLERIKNALDIPALSDMNDIDEFANEFLDESLRHHEYGDDDLMTHSAMAVVPLCQQVYHLLLALSKDEMTFDDAVFSSAWQDIKNELEKFSHIYSYIQSLIKKNKQLERNIRIIHKSVVWKLAYPLRVIDDALRVLRRKRHEKRRLSPSV